MKLRARQAGSRSLLRGCGTEVALTEVRGWRSSQPQTLELDTRAPRLPSLLRTPFGLTLPSSPTSMGTPTPASELSPLVPTSQLLSSRISGKSPEPRDASQHFLVLKPLLTPSCKRTAFLGTPMGPRAPYLRADVYLPPTRVGSFWKGYHGAGT